MEMLRWIQENCEWFFDGIGVVFVTGIGGIIVKKIAKKKKNDVEKPKITHNYNVAGDDNINGCNNIKGNGNINGSGNVVNYYATNAMSDNGLKEQNKSWFAIRFERMLTLLNDARWHTEKEYTIEFISGKLGLTNVSYLKQYLVDNNEPDDVFKEKFVEVFGVNREWMVYNRGQHPFASNVQLSSDWPMDILRQEKLKDIQEFIVVIGKYEGLRHALIIKHTTEFCYELYPNMYILHSNVGMRGTHRLTDLYRFFREAARIRKLHSLVYEATEQQFADLYKGNIAPMMVKKMGVAKFFEEKFVDLSFHLREDIERFWDKDLIKVQGLINEDIVFLDNVNQETDRKIITQRLEEEDLTLTNISKRNGEKNISSDREEISAASTLYFDLLSIEDYLVNERSSVNLRYCAEWQKLLAICTFLTEKQKRYIYKIYDEVYNYNYYYEQKHKEGICFSKEEVPQYNKLKEAMFDTSGGYINVKKHLSGYEEVLEALKKHYS